MLYNEKYPPRADVVFTVMFLNKILCEKTLKIILGEDIELSEIAVESKNDLHKAALNSIYFDVKTQAKDGRIFTLDLQRKYIKNRVRKRTIYYACREIAAQVVTKSQYENLKSVVVSFLLTEASLKSTTDNKTVRLLDSTTGELYSDLLTIHEVNIKHISEHNSLEMQILRDFFQIESQDTFNIFVESYKNTEYGNLLLKNYMSAVSDTSLLDTLSEEGKFMNRLSEEERLEERLEEKFEIAKNMLKKGFSIDDISEITGLSKEEIQKIS